MASPQSNHAGPLLPVLQDPVGCLVQRVEQEWLAENEQEDEGGDRRGGLGAVMSVQDYRTMDAESASK
jgi:hypothetical protein